jgi:hypothetical protein
MWEEGKKKKKKNLHGIDPRNADLPASKGHITTRTSFKNLKYTHALLP